MKKLVFPLLVGGMVWSYGVARAQDIININSDQAGATYTAAGDSIDIKFRLYSASGYFALTNSGGGTLALYPTLAVRVNGTLASAALVGWTSVSSSSGYKTDVIFRYTVKPGDMAAPLRIYGASGGSGSGDPYTFVWNGWSIANLATGSNAIWQVNVPYIESGFSTLPQYLDFSARNVNIRTLSFPQGNVSTLAATDSATWQVTTVDATLNSVALHIWTPGTNIVQIGTVAAQTDLGLTMATGTTNAAFTVKGLSVGTAKIYAMREQDYQSFSSSTNFMAALTNYIWKTITVTAPPEPTVSIVMSDTGTDSVTLPETNTQNTGKFKVMLSQAFTNDVDVRLDTSAVGQPVGQGYVTFSATPYIVTVAKGQTLSSEKYFNLPDGNVTSMWGVTISPVITNTVAAAYYSNKKPGFVYVQNVKPSVTATYTPPATRGVPCTFSWTAADVAADLASGMKVAWNFNGEGTTNVTGGSGSLQYTFTSTGSKTIRVTATDKDGAVSDEYSFVITVNPPVPKPSVHVVPSASVYDETTTNSTGSLVVTLSESYSDDVWVLLTSTLQGASQSNIVFATTNAIRIAQGSTNSATIKFSIPDGTPASEVYGIDIVPTVTNSPAKSYFTDLQQTTVFVDNVPPTVTKPVARDPSLVPLSIYTNVVMGRPFTFDYIVKDVTADTASMIVNWNFGDGSGALVVTGAVGSVVHTYSSLGIKTVSMQATDKDGGQSDLIEFPISVVSPPPVPTVRILSPSAALTETTTPKTGSFIVQLSEAFTNVVTVDLAMNPVTNAVNGAIIFSTNRVVFAVGDTEKTVYISARDGTVASWVNGFDIIPSLPVLPGNANGAAIAYFTTFVNGNVEVMNVSPSILTPLATDITTTAILYTVPQNSPFYFPYVVIDNSPDDLNNAPPYPYAMRVDFYFGDGATATAYGGTGTVSHVYATTGDLVVRVVATDKDGGTTSVQFKITVKPSKEVLATPIGPNFESAYYGAAGLGYGTIYSREARTPVNNLNNAYYFIYDPNVISATLAAIPYKTAPLGYYNVTNYSSSGAAVASTNRTLFDSFFFVWVGTDQGLSADAVNPAKTTSTTVISLPAAAADTTSIDIRNVEAIFSREWRIADNMGDINQDGIPDKIAIRLESSTATGTGTADTGALPIGLKNLASLNADLDKSGTAVGDYLPINPTGAQGVFDFRPVSDGKGGNDFTAYLETRGFDPGLNMPGVSDPDGVADEPYTDPLLEDTDGDGFPDGYEYYFWYNAKFKGMTGSAYNPNDVAVGTTLSTKVIELAFQPNVAATEGANTRDLDKDGLLDIEEMVIGTNPVNWDTDGDGVCDTWEVMRGMNPCNAADGLSALKNNPDGDYMAYASVPRQFVTVVTGGTVTNTYLAAGAALGTNTGTFTTWYNYGNSNAPIAVGRAAALATNAFVTTLVNTNALVLHFQVFREFGFDPRTAWTAAINPLAFPARFPTWCADAVNTKPFTSVDEYLLMKFMSETRMNGATASMAADVNTWKAFTTDPMTPDSDVTAQHQDGMPDGWELYVSVDPSTDLSVAANRVMAISPWNPLDGDLDHPTVAQRDGLVNRREFGGTDSSAAYANPALYGNTNFLGVVSITRPAVDAKWVNKFWPTNPWSPDTDGDGVNDLAESTAFAYGTAVDNGTTCIQGGGLNPNSVDTDLDALPDGWEVQFTGTLPTDNTKAYSGIVITNGMDGTVSDYAEDWDHDGLLNYQEYWVQAVRSFRYDITDAGTVNSFGVPGQPMDASFAPSSLFTQITANWDVAKYPWGDKNPNLWIMLPLGPSKLYASTDPRNYDTDGDGMDDFYEMFHGLNPILGDDIISDGLLDPASDRIAQAYMDHGAFTITYLYNDWGYGLPMDFVKYPWLTGLPEADPDADGLLNLEEKLQPNTAAPDYYNTDPTPMWLTDDSNTNSVTARFYHPMGYGPYMAGTYSSADTMFYWPHLPFPPGAMYSYEMNEGYDTDNDGISDKAELIDSRNKLSDPRDSDDPVRRQAIWFSGTNSAASSFWIPLPATNGVWTLRSFTTELWARPEIITTNHDQVLLERVLVYSPSDLSTSNLVIRHNFRIGISADGRVYGMFENAGSHDEHTATVYAYGNVLKTNEWVHIAARMDGANGAFTLFVNGEIRAAVSTELIPANGTMVVRSNPNSPETSLVYSGISGTIMLGAANITPRGFTLQKWSDYAQFYKGYIDEVRIWDGARSNDEILSNYKKRFRKSDLMNNRLLVRTDEAKGYSRVWTDPLQLPAELLYHYTFDNLFGADITNSVATAPRGFTATAVAMNRPKDATIGWWAGAAVKSTVYNDYDYMPWIENGVDHLPLFGGYSRSNGIVTVLMTNTVMDSAFWTHTTAGGIAGSYSFPNKNNPYTFCFLMDPKNPRFSDYTIDTDLLPMGTAFAKQVAAMWDGNGPSGAWLETATDSDFDGLPDWWENNVITNSLFTSLHLTQKTVTWDGIYPDGSGMTYGERYQRDVANGATPTNPTGVGGLKQTADSDGDGMPDWWENIYNLDPASDQGDDGALGDPDRDGLSNLAEYMISEVYGFRHLNPRQFKTDPTQPVSDYFMKQGSLTLGAMFTDHDFVEDAWEDQFDPNFISRYVYDPFSDLDEDGWSSWAECRYSVAHGLVFMNNQWIPKQWISADANQWMVGGPQHYLPYPPIPVPTNEVTLRYNGQLKSVSIPIVLQVYKSATMDGVPDATYTYADASYMWPKRICFTTANNGYVREGTNYVFAFMDVNGSGAWDAGEPCGVATPFVTDIGWDYNRLDIQLTDYTPGYLRMTWSPGLRSEDVFAGKGGAGAGGTATGGTALQAHVRVRRTMVDGYTSYQRFVLDKVIQAPRTYLHEGDLFAQGEFGLDWGLVNVPTSLDRANIVYDVYVGDEELLTNNLRAVTFTNTFELANVRALTPAQATSPISGKYVYSARPTFRWTMPDGYTAFAIEIKKGSTNGLTIYQSGTVQVPSRDSITGEYIWEAPIHAGNTLPSGQVFSSNTLYAWRVISLNSKYTLTTAPITWSSWNVFRLDVNAPADSSGYGELRVQVKYYGAASKYLSGRVKVQAFRNRGFTGVPEQQYTLSDAEIGIMTNATVVGTNAVMRGLTPSYDPTGVYKLAGNYYVRAFIDHNTNNVRDVWESWGYANYYGLTDTPYDVRPSVVTVSGSSDLATVTIEDADSDQDWFPDAWEYEQNPDAANFLQLTGPSESWLNGDTEVNPKLLTSSPFSQMSVLLSLAMGTSDQDHDGVSDMAELILGTNPNAASTAGDGYTDAAKMSIGLAGSDQLAVGLTAINVSGTDANVTWKVDVNKAASVSRTFLSALTGIASDAAVTYHIEYTPSLLNGTWTEVRSGAVVLDGGKTVSDLIDTQNVIDPDKGFFRVRLSK